MIGVTSGGLGDVVYSIKVMRKLGIETVYVKESFYGPGEGSLYANIKPLLELNGFEVLPTPGGLDPMEFDPSLKFDYNLDNFRLMGDRNRVHIIINQHLCFGLPFPDDYKEPWLTLDDKPSGLRNDITMFFVTQRWRGDMAVNWRQLVEEAERPVFFGIEEDYYSFVKETGLNSLCWIRTTDILDLARCVRDAKKVICNQSVVLALCQGIGREYYTAFKPGKTNCRFFTANEHALE